MEDIKKMETYSRIYKKIYVSTTFKRRQTYIRKEKITQIVSSYFNKEKDIENKEEVKNVENKQEETNLTKNQLLDIYADKVYDNKPLNINKLSKQDKNLIEYSIQVSWLNELMRLEKISDIEYERIKALLISKYKIQVII